MKFIYHTSAKFNLLDYCDNIKVIFLITSNPLSFSIIQCIIINYSHHSLYKISWTLSCHCVFFLHKPHSLLATIILHLISIGKGFFGLHTRSYLFFSVWLISHTLSFRLIHNDTVKVLHVDCSKGISSFLLLQSWWKEIMPIYPNKPLTCLPRLAKSVENDFSIFGQGQCH